MDLSLRAKSVTINPSGSKEVDLEIDTVEESDVLDHFTIAQVVKHFGMDEILDFIGESEVISHFDLEKE